MNPLASIFGAGVRLRNALYDRGNLPVRRLQGPTISVGNLSVGGSGKTPFVLLLGELLKTRGVKFDVLSRGYGRHTQGVLRVEPGGSSAERYPPRLIASFSVVTNPSASLSVFTRSSSRTSSSL